MGLDVNHGVTSTVGTRLMDNPLGFGPDTSCLDGVADDLFSWARSTTP